MTCVGVVNRQSGANAWEKSTVDVSRCRVREAGACNLDETTSNPQRPNKSFRDSFRDIFGDPSSAHDPSTGFLVSPPPQLSPLPTVTSLPSPTPATPASRGLKKSSRRTHPSRRRPPHIPSAPTHPLRALPPTMTSSPVAVAATPAWKKLGLKVKSAADDTPVDAKPEKKEKKSKKRKAEMDAMDVDVEAQEGKRVKGEDGERKIKKVRSKEKKGEAEEVEAEETGDKKEKKEKREKKDKKEKKAKDTVEGTTEKMSATALTESQKESTPETPSASTTPPLLSTAPKSLLKSPVKPKGPKRSVQFSDETKTEDGDSIKQMYLALDPFGKNRTRGIVTSETGTSITPPAESKKAKRAKNKAASAADAGPKINRHLSYLDTFHTAREHWKFKKAEQNWVIRNAMNVEAVPKESEDALEAYIKSLQGAAARDRMLMDARKLLGKKKRAAMRAAKEAAGETVEKETKETKEGEEEEEEEKEITEEMRTRARVVLRALGHTYDSESETDSDSGDSASSSSSDSDSSSEDED